MMSRNDNTRVFRMGCKIEFLENRLPLDNTWQNGDLNCDVNNVELVTPIDVLVLINSINSDGARKLTARDESSTEPYYDVNGDCIATTTFP